MEITEQTAAAQDGSDIDESKVTVPEEVSLLPLKEFVLFPAVVMPLVVTREASIKLIDDAAVANNRVIGVVTLRDPNVEKPMMGDVYPVGCLAAIRMMVRMPDGVRLIVQGLKRIKVDEPVQEEPYLRARVSPLEDVPAENPEAAVEVQAMAR